ncbi:MAG: metalloregulator ArsR/SmtB family transcription factor [Nanoarchaeota archaeon]
MRKINPKVIQFFEALADETRLKILLSISKGPIAVNEIHREVGEPTLSAISHQLRTMSDLDIVRFEKKGREKFYRLSDAHCWCPLRDAFSQMSNKTKCPHCAMLFKKGSVLI